MKTSDVAVTHAPVDQVRTAYDHPAVLACAIPGCQELLKARPDAGGVTDTAGVVSIKGTYEAAFTLTEQNPPGSFVRNASGAGAAGTLSVAVKVGLQDSTTGGTYISYDVDAVVGGVVGDVGQLILTDVATMMAGEFFAAVDAYIATVSGPATTAHRCREAMT